MLQETGLQGTTEADRQRGERKVGGGKEVLKPSTGRQAGRRKLRKKSGGQGVELCVVLEVSKTLLASGWRLGRP